MAGFLGTVRGRKRSAAVLRSLAEVEVPEVMDHASAFPIAIRKATGARVTDADGNRYLDLTGFFGVALAGHRNPAVATAIRTQAGRLLHGMGDVHPAEVKARLLRLLAARMPAPGYRGLLGLSGADAVEAALKFAAAATGRGAVLAFEGAYHGLSGAALEVTHGRTFREPFRAALSGRGRFAPWPARDGSDLDRCLSAARALARDPANDGPAGAVIVEPIQGRGGIRVPPPGFLAGLAGIAREAGAALVVDEVYTGCGRTGAFLASAAGIRGPDAICLGKALGGGLPISACMMAPGLASAVKGLPSEAPHTGTFLGHPLGAAAAIAVLGEIDRRGLLAAAVRVGDRIRERADAWRRRFPSVADVRGAGAMVGVELARPEVAGRTVEAALRAGVILLTEGPAGDVLAFTPPLTIADADLDRALSAVETALAEAAT
ncbi:MAG: aspartate aminotransferase family protein [Deltaproteobacteria bacterium]|nr:aspartate aminotransferase family protein [Deltaproteobacteria bacterium]